MRGCAILPHLRSAIFREVAWAPNKMFRFSVLRQRITISRQNSIFLLVFSRKIALLQPIKRDDESCFSTVQLQERSRPETQHALLLLVRPQVDKESQLFHQKRPKIGPFSQEEVLKKESRKSGENRTFVVQSISQINHGIFSFFSMRGRFFHALPDITHVQQPTTLAQGCWKYGGNRHAQLSRMEVDLGWASARGLHGPFGKQTLISFAKSQVAATRLHNAG